MSKRNGTKRPRVLVLGGGMVSQLQIAGAEAVSIGYTDQRAVEAAAHDNIHALVLTGGSDIGPNIYGQKPHRLTQSTHTQRDVTELLALKAAVKRGIPVLGVCRGSQMINAAFGGTLHQHLDDVKHAHKFHLGHDHRVKVIEGSRLRHTLGTDEQWVVSIHHQAVDKVAPGFRVAARGLDGIVEAIESIEGWILGVQFHPEIATNQVTQRVFNDLVIQAALRAGLPKPKPYVPPKPKPPAVQKYNVATDNVWRMPKAKPAWKPTRFVSSPDGELLACYQCGVQFDEKIDHVDHMWFLHGVDLLEKMDEESILEMIREDES